jgi:uncharacterized protein (TIGR02722 family)
MRIKYFMSMACFVFLAGCLVSCSSVKVTRTDTSKTVDLSGSWNDSDSRMVSEEMVKDCISRAWLTNFELKNSRPPVIIAGTILNRTAEHIDAKIFVSDLERSLINTNRVKFVAASPERLELRTEKEDQALHASRETARQLNVETGADFMLQGNIGSIKDEISRKYVIFYQVNLELVDLTTNEKVWIGQKEIKKIVSQKAFGL